MKYCLSAFFIAAIFISLAFWIPQKAYALTCGQFVVESDSRCTLRVGPTTKQLSSTCTYTESTYECTDGVELVRCIRKNPDIDCGNGVTVCGGPAVNDGYNCVRWCSDVYSGYTRPCEILRDTNTIFTDDFPGTGNGRNDYCYNGSRCINPAAGGTTCTAGSANCVCDSRSACTDYVSQCVTNTRNNCETNECNNAGTLPTNACPGSADVQCDPTHSCVFQQPVTQVIQPPTVTLTVNNVSVLSLNKGDTYVLSWSTTHTDSTRRFFDN